MPTLNRLIADGQPLERVALVIAAWALYLEGVDERGERFNIVDPRADYCQALVAEREQISVKLLGAEAIFGTAIPQSAAFVAAFQRNLDSLRSQGVSATLQTLLG